MNAMGSRGVFGRGRVALIVAMLALLATSCRQDLPQVDWGDVWKDDNASAEDDQRPALRVAVGAMMSPETTRGVYQDLVCLIAERLRRRAILAQRRTYAEVNALLAQKELDFAFVCAGSYVRGHDEFGMEILAVPLIHGKKVYHSYILVHPDNDLQCLDDLKRRRFAFTDPDSNTGCLVPCYMLALRGQTPRSFFGDTFFTYSHESSISAVAEGRADGAAVDSLVWEFMHTVDPSLTSRSRVLEKSPPYGNPPLVVHPDLDPDLKKRLREVLLSLHEDQQALPLLHALQIDRFTEGQDSAYDSVREMRRYLNQGKENRP